MADYWWFPCLPERVLVPSCVSSQGHSWRLSTHCSSSNYQLCPRHVFKPFCPSHSGRGLAEDRGTLPWPRGLSLCRAGSPKDLWTVPARRKSIQLRPHGLTFSWNVQNLEDVSWNKKSTKIILVISSNQSPQIASLNNIICGHWLLSAGRLCCSRSPGDRADKGRQALRLGPQQLRMGPDAVCHSQSWNHICGSISV